MKLSEKIMQARTTWLNLELAQRTILESWIADAQELEKAGDVTKAAVLKYRGLILDSGTIRVTIDGAEVQMFQTEFRLLRVLMENVGRVLSRQKLLDKAWSGAFIEERTVDVHMRRLRISLAPSGYDKFLCTNRGSGYQLAAE